MESQPPNYSSLDKSPPLGSVTMNLEVQIKQDQVSPNNMESYQNENNGGSDSVPHDSPEKQWNWITSLRCHPFLYQLFVFIFLPIWIWLAIFALVGDDALPHGHIFVLVLLACGGRILGTLLEHVHLPPMIGMLGLGLVLRNVPGVDFGRDLNPVWSSPIRQTALAVILTRAGLGLDPKILLAFKGLILRFALFPTVLEAVSVTIVAHLVLDMPWVWALLLGCVLAPVSPAVVVPRLLELKQAGYGMDKGIPTIIIASASLDNVIAISLFGVVLNFALADATQSLAYSILQGPLQVLIGCGYGLFWGFVLGMIFNTEQKGDSDIMVVRFLLTLAGGLISVIGLSKLGFSGAGALGCLLSAFIAASIWRTRDVTEYPDPVSKIFFLLWRVAEPLLFGVIGCQIDVLTLELDTILLGLGCICVGLFVRLLTVLCMVSKAGLNKREKLFAAISWIPKATVQAAIGPIALEMVRKRHEPNITEEKYGENILTLAVLTILLTAPIGELAVMFTGRRFLSKN